MSKFKVEKAGDHEIKVTLPNDSKVVPDDISPEILYHALSLDLVKPKASPTGGCTIDVSSVF